MQFIAESIILDVALLNFQYRCSRDRRIQLRFRKPFIFICLIYILYFKINISLGGGHPVLCMSYMGSFISNFVCSVLSCHLTITNMIILNLDLSNKISILSIILLFLEN